MTEKTSGRRRRAVTFAIIVSAVALVACAKAGRGPAAGTTPTPADESPSIEAGLPIDWNNPIVLGVEVASTDALAEVVSFTPILSSRGEPLRVLVNDPESFDKADRGFAAQYVTADKGTYWLLEEPTDMTQKDLEGIPSQCDPKQGCQGTWELASLDDGTTGLLIDGPASVGVVWLHDGIYFDVIGPPGDFSRDEAIAEANAVAKQYQQ
jgi:hypothetical protein